MNDVFISTLGGLLAFWFWGTSDWLVSKNSKKYNVYEVNLATKIASLITSLFLLAFNFQNIEGLSQLIPFIIVGFLFAVAFVFMIKALTDGAVGVIVPVISTNPLFTLALAIIFGGSVLSVSQVLSILIIICGVLALTYQKNIRKIPLKELHKDTAYALLAAVIWGVAFYIINQNVADVPWQIVYGTVGLSSFIFSLLLVLIKLRKNFRSVIIKTGANKIGLLSGLCLTIGSLAFFYSAGRVGNVLILIVIAACSPLVASLLSAIYDHEKLGYLKRLGAVLAIGGIVLLNTVK